MDYRNARFNVAGGIDCEIDHPELGWIPFTADPADTGAEFDVASLYAEMGPHAAPYVPPPEPSAEELRAAIPPLSFAQLLTGLVAMEWITETEGLAWLKSEALPADIEQLIAGLPQEQQFPTTARAMRMTVAERMDPLVDALAAVRGFSPEQIDQFFLAFGDAAMQIEA